MESTNDIAVGTQVLRCSFCGRRKEATPEETLVTDRHQSAFICHNCVIEAGAKFGQAAMSAALPPFLALVAQEVERARSKHLPLNSAHEAYAVILEEVDEFWDEVKRKREERDPQAMLDELVRIGAMATRAAEDLRLLPQEP